MVNPRDETETHQSSSKRGDTPKTTACRVKALFTFAGLDIRRSGLWESGVSRVEMARSVRLIPNHLHPT